MLVVKKTPAAPMEFFQPEQWMHLLEQLDIILATVQGDDSNPILRRFGPRRRSAVFRRLMQERRRLVKEIEAFGHEGLLAFAKNQTPDATPAHRHLDAEFRLLGDAFDQCSRDLSPDTQAALKSWLVARSHMHREHARFLETY
ncbi:MULTISPECIES: hypothetical protein [unclassified Variovorax]|jgi:hypothetical protein|uniref:hypothetical protein n=1 Tax=unclassified Variovorax TaxID=663243 RepID=UPI000F7D9091|nr:MULTISPECIES: hypothetical protein [unclassified Variovorax]RSZ44189.1 hypothetical protein EJO70_09725 [Variovorax sp. 553]RSZ45155.1 hypothetical protein EJO71_08115 [Variovorax sp. 679]